VQAEFVEARRFQCGYCTPGQICSAVAASERLSGDTLSAATFDPILGARARATIAISDASQERMSGNSAAAVVSNIVAP